MNWLERLLSMKVAPSTAATWAPVFEKHAQPEAFSRGVDEMDDFLGQVLHESSMLTRVEENLRYTKPERIQAVWPTRFARIEDAMPYANNPQGLANKVYGGRIGNTEPDDGWKYRGRGLIQITGKANYTAVSKTLGIDLVESPDLMCKPSVALLSAIAWWENNILDIITDDVIKVTKRVNGGTIGLDHRIALTNSAKDSFA